MRCWKWLSCAVMVVVLECVPAIAVEPERKHWTVDGVEREALVFRPARQTADPSPLVLAFHGHGGTAGHASRRFRIHEEWPEAIVVYPQGLPTPGRLTDPEGRKPGWQSSAGDQKDRDLHLFDVILKDVRDREQVDANRVYAMGHSNGGAFSYLLWAHRGKELAAIAPVAASTREALTPKPVLHVAGRNDPLVRFAWQEATIRRLRDVNECDATGAEWAPGCLKYGSRRDSPVVTFLHSGGHEFPDAAPELIVRFFKEHRRPAESSKPVASP